MPSLTGGGLLRMSVALEEGQVGQVDGVAKALVPPASRNSAIRYLLGLGLAEHNRRQEQTTRALAVLLMAREEATA